MRPPDSPQGDPSPSTVGTPFLPSAWKIGRYEILGELGRGGMGVVYKAFDPQLRRTVALKLPFFDPARPDHAIARQRFLRETESAAKVEHPNVCPVYDAGEIDGAPFAVMKFLEGGSLADLLRQGPKPMPLRQAVTLACKIAQGLREIHRAGIVHRDLKPGNVLLGAGLEPCVSDFGLACQATDPRLTPDGAAVGTPAYLAPEQAEGQSRGAPTMDVYSLGVMLYEMLTGRLPFTGSLLQILQQAAQEARPRPSAVRPEIDAGLEAIVLRAMARHPEDRFQTAKDMAEALATWLASAERQRTDPQETTAVVRRPAGRRPLLLAVAGVVVALAVLVTAAAVFLPSGRRGDNAGGDRDDEKEPEDRGRTGPGPPRLVMLPAKLDGVHTWTIEPREPRRGEAGNHHSLAWSRNGWHAAVSAWAKHGFCTIRRVETGAVETRIEGATFPFGSDPWCREGIKTMLALTKGRGGPGALGLYTDKGAYSRTLTVAAMKVKHPVSSFRASKMGDYLAWGDDDAKTAYVSELRATKAPDGPTLTLDSPIQAIAWGVTDSDYHHVALQRDGEVVVYHTVFHKLLHRYPCDGRLLAWSPFSAQLATQRPDGALVLCHPLTGEEQLKLVGHKGKVTSVSWRTSEGQLASVDDRGSLRHWDLQSGKQVASHQLPHASAPWAFAPFGQTLACAADDAVYFASGQDGTPLGVSLLLGDKDYVAISAEGHTAGSPGFEGAIVYVVETEQGRQALTPGEFAKRYGWANDAKRVKLVR